MIMDSMLHRYIISCFPTVPPEAGGLLGENKDGVICAFCYDPGQIELNRAIYTPNVNFLNNQIINWKKKEITFCGIVHSHRAVDDNLSDGDKVYITRIMMDYKEAQKLYFPLVIPNIKIIPFVAVRQSNGVMINRAHQITLVEGGEIMEKVVKTEEAKIPCGQFCGGNCSDCCYTETYKRDSNGRQYCNYYGKYWWPSERQGCLSYKRY